MILRVATVGVLAVALLNWPGSEPDNDNLRLEPRGVTDRAPLELPDTTVVEINRALARRIVADPDLLVEGAHWHPLLSAGDPPGVMLRAVSAHSLLDAFGFRDHDVLLLAPGESFDFRRDEVVFRVQRAGRDRRIVVRVTDG